MAPAVFLTLVLAQSAPAEAADPAQIERIRKALTETQAITVAPPTRVEDSVFRVTVYGRKPGPRRCTRSGFPSCRSSTSWSRTSRPPTEQDACLRRIGLQRP